jgi:hypothetical protein
MAWTIVAPERGHPTMKVRLTSSFPNKPGHGRHGHQESINAGARRGLTRRPAQ